MILSINAFNKFVSCLYFQNRKKYQRDFFMLYLKKVDLLAKVFTVEVFELNIFRYKCLLFILKSAIFDIYTIC